MSVSVGTIIVALEVGFSVNSCVGLRPEICVGVWFLEIAGIFVGLYLLLFFCSMGVQLIRMTANIKTNNE